MTDFTRDWIANRRKLLDAATEGPWEYLSRNVIETPVIDVSEADWGGEGLHGYRLVAWQDSGAWRNEDAEFIADARTSLPAALAALKAVLEGHRPVSFSFSWRDGVTMHEVCPGCQDKAGVHPCGCWRDEDTPHLCAVCSDIEHRMDVPYPCMTVRAIEAALRGES